MRQGPLLVIPFANLDQMIYHQTTGEFAYWYAETEKLVRSLVGRKCIVSWNMPATVVDVNTSVGGFYPGYKYPLVCKLDSGATFEYSFDGFSLVENEGEENAA